MGQLKEFSEYSVRYLRQYRTGRYRLAYHVMPVFGWMNDPHGLLWWNGSYHLFCNVYPYDATHPFAGKYWAHFASENLVDFTCLPAALAPDREMDADGCASGCAVEANGRLCLLYTARNRAHTPSEKQALAVSEDGINFRKQNHGQPVLVAPARGNDFRDPKLFFYHNKWHMLLGNRNGEEGQVLVYISEDLLNWKDEGVFCVGAPALGFMWECPDYVRIGEQDYLILSPEGMGNSRHTTGYFCGTLHESGLRFARTAWHTLDHGRDFYAPQTFCTPDHRTMLVAWMQKWFTDIPTAADGWVGAVTIPRELRAGADGLLEMHPARELETLRFTEEHYAEQTLCEDDPMMFRCGAQFELRCVIDLRRCTARMAILTIGGAQFIISLLQKTISASFQNSGEAPAPTCTVSLARPDENLLDITIYVDRSSIEFLAECGVTSITNRIYPNVGDLDGFSLSATGGQVMFSSLSFYQLREAKMHFAL